MPERPNILFFFSDEHRYDWLGSIPDIPVRTPNLDALGQRGVRFTNAVCPAPVCGPSRACLASGLEFDSCGVPNNYVNYPGNQSSYYRILRDEADYHVAGCGKFDLHKGQFDWGTDGRYMIRDLGFTDGIDNADKGYATSLDRAPFNVLESDDLAEPYLSYLDDEGLLEAHLENSAKRSEQSFTGTFPTPLPEEAYLDNWVGRNGLALLDDVPDGTPWHLVVNFTSPHPPMDATEEMHEWYRGDDPIEFPAPTLSGDEHDRETHMEVRRNYSAAVENIDRWIGTYVDELKERGEFANTIIVYSSDHGEMLGNRGKWGKRVPYQPSVGVPLILAGPGIEARGAVDVPANTIDLHATFLDYAGVATESQIAPLNTSVGVAEPRSATRTGEYPSSTSMRPYIEGEEGAPRTYVHSGVDGSSITMHSTWRMVFDGRYKLISNWHPADRDEHIDDGDPVLFDLETDPAETENVADREPDVVDELIGKLG